MGTPIARLDVLRTIRNELRQAYGDFVTIKIVINDEIVDGQVILEAFVKYRVIRMVIDDLEWASPIQIADAVNDEVKREMSRPSAP